MKRTEQDQQDKAADRAMQHVSREALRPRNDCENKCPWGETERTGDKPDWYATLFH